MLLITFRGDTYPTIVSEEMRLNKIVRGFHGFTKKEIKNYISSNFEYSTQTKTVSNSYFINPYTVLQKRFSIEFGCYFLTQIKHEEIK